MSEALEAFPREAYVPLLGDEFPGTKASGPRTVALAFSSWGDSGQGGARYLLAGRNGVSPEVYEDKARYEAAISSRMLFRSPPATVTGGIFLMSMHCLFDGRECLPPFLPLGRGEDGLWAASLSLLHPGLRLAYSPLATHHAPPLRLPEGRAGAIQWNFGLSDFLLFLMAGSVQRGECVEYEKLAERLEAFGCLAASDMRDLVLFVNNQALEARRRSLEAALAAFDAEPRFWADDIEAAIDVLKAEACGKTPRFPRELPDPASLGPWLAEFGRLLSLWQEIFEAAREFGPRVLESSRLGI